MAIKLVSYCLNIENYSSIKVTRNEAYLKISTPTQPIYVPIEMSISSYRL